MGTRHRTVPVTAALTAVVVLLVTAGSGGTGAAEPTSNRAEQVQIPLNPLPFEVKGYLRRPNGAGPFPGVVVIPPCERFVTTQDRNWGEVLASWGYAALTLDVFTPHGIVGSHSCIQPVPPQLAEDLYRGLDLLIARKLVDPEHVAVMGFGRGASLAFAAVDSEGAMQHTKHKFRAAIAFYPSCGDTKGVMTAPTLVLAGERDEAGLDPCRKMAAGEDDMGISRPRGAGAQVRLVVLPDAYAGFDLPPLSKAAEIRGVHFEYGKAATDSSREVVRQFLQSMAGPRR
jgi:dienelactone hydrolase